MIRRAFSTGTLLLVIAQGVMTGGCAGNVPAPQQDRRIVDAYRLDADDHPTLLVDMAPGVAATDKEKDQFTRLLSERLEARRMRNGDDGTATQCDVHVTVTRLDKASKPAHSVATGLGQIHLDATVLVTPAGGGDPLDRFAISKTFSWGGPYGASEDIENIEPSFADSIAAALTGQPVGAEKVATVK